MPSKIQAISKQIAGFGVVGIIAFIIDYGLLIVLKECFGVPVVAAATVSFVVSLCVNYLLSMRYVFVRKEGMGRGREFAIFAILSVVGLGINDLVIWVGSVALPFDYRIVKIVATAIVMVWNYLTRRKFLHDKSGEKG